MSTTMPKAQNITRKWYVIDAADKPLGRTAAKAAELLRGKHNRFLLHTLTVVTMSSSSTLRKLSSPVKNWFRRFTTITPAGLAV